MKLDQSIYYLKQNYSTILDEFDIVNSAGIKVFSVKQSGKFLGGLQAVIWGFLSGAIFIFIFLGLANIAKLLHQETLVDIFNVVGFLGSFAAFCIGFSLTNPKAPFVFYEDASKRMKVWTVGSEGIIQFPHERYVIKDRRRILARCRRLISDVLQDRFIWNDKDGNQLSLIQNGQIYKYKVTETALGTIECASIQFYVSELGRESALIRMVGLSNMMLLYSARREGRKAGALLGLLGVPSWQSKR
ncbi:MAG: hypothetical protein F6J87_29320 [Spirulina sp. SIO3F2]|nr:hypothetical protein [Spirulina sp. SIO3F2]